MAYLSLGSETPFDDESNHKTKNPKKSKIMPIQGISLPDLQNVDV